MMELQAEIWDDKTDTYTRFTLPEEVDELIEYWKEHDQDNLDIDIVPGYLGRRYTTKIMYLTDLAFEIKEYGEFGIDDFIEDNLADDFLDYHNLYYMDQLELIVDTHFTPYQAFDLKMCEEFSYNDDFFLMDYDGIRSVGDLESEELLGEAFEQACKDFLDYKHPTN